VDEKVRGRLKQGNDMEKFNILKKLNSVEQEFMKNVTI
jgi:hypothetical protein